MTNRSVWLATSLFVAMATPALAQDVRWNDRAVADTLDDAPMVRVMIDGPRVFDYGDPVRVRFSVSHDAYVIVARVDGNGHLTLLYPANRTSSLVTAGEDIPVRGRRSGSWATFFANDRMSGGYVFAMASYDPFDLSRLTIRDFDRYVTGTYVGRPTRTYIGDPHRVIDRFAQMVTYEEETPFDYDVDFYSVDSPTWVTSAGYSRYCGYNGYNGYGGYNGYRASLHERWDDEFYYGAGGSGFGCSGYNAYCFGLQAVYGYGSFGCRGLLGNRIAQGPRYPTQPPSDSGRRANPWVGDSVARPDTVSRTVGGNRPQQIQGDSKIVVDAIRRPTVSDYDDGDRVFSIPDRALRGIGRHRGEVKEPTAAEPGTRSGAIAGDEQIRWVRPPRDVDRRNATDANGAGTGVVPPRDRERRANGGDRGADGGHVAIDRERLPARTSRPPRDAEPPRASGRERFNSPPPPSRSGPEIRATPPSRSEPRSEPRSQPRSEPRSEPRPQPTRRDPPPRVERRDPPPAPARVERRDPPPAPARVERRDPPPAPASSPKTEKKPERQR